MKHKVSIKITEMYAKEMVKELTIEAKSQADAEAEALAAVKEEYLANKILIPSSFKLRSHSIELAK